MSDHELLERLVAIVPRPRAHLTRYFGVFAPAFAADIGASTRIGSRVTMYFTSANAVGIVVRLF